MLVASVTTGLAAVGVFAYFVLHNGMRVRIDRHPLRLKVWTQERRQIDPATQEAAEDGGTVERMEDRRRPERARAA